jgi:hypothetical protein
MPLPLGTPRTMHAAPWRLLVALSTSVVAAVPES